MSINKDQIVAEFGNVYRDGGQGIKDLRLALLRPTETDALFQFLPTNDTVLYKASVSTTRVLQQFQKLFTPIGSTLFELEKLELDHIKIDVAEYPDDLMTSWLGFLAGPSVKRVEWPFVKFWLEQLVVPKFKEDLELEVFTAVKTAITEGIASPINTSITGIRKRIRDGHAAGKTKMYSMGIPPTDPVQFVQYVEDMIDQIDDIIVGKLDKVVMNKTFVKRFKRGMRLKYNVNYEQTADLLTVQDTSLPIVGVESMTGSNMIWTTVKGNAANPVKWAANKGVFDVQPFDRQVKAMNDLWTAYGFWHLPWVFHNDQDLAPTV